ncbi:hypothetical protein ACWF9B_08690 [Streptomyces sp. NPDC055089]
MTVRVITLDNGRIALVSPYNEDVPDAAHAIGGRWDPTSRHWHFDGRDEERVRELARNIFGTDGSPEAEADTVTVRWAVGDLTSDKEIRLAGRRVAERRYRDSSVTLGEGVVVVQGGFKGSGGSMRNPTLNAKDNTVLEIRDVPRTAVPTDDPDITVVDDQVDVEKLTAERTRLLARLAEIDATLAAHGHTTA